jgi:endonuclease III
VTSSDYWLLIDEKGKGKTTNRKHAKRSENNNNEFFVAENGYQRTRALKIQNLLRLYYYHHHHQEEEDGKMMNLHDFFQKRGGKDQKASSDSFGTTCMNNSSTSERISHDKSTVKEIEEKKQQRCDNDNAATTAVNHHNESVAIAVAAVLDDDNDDDDVDDMKSSNSGVLEIITIDDSDDEDQNDQHEKGEVSKNGNRMLSEAQSEKEAMDDSTSDSPRDYYIKGMAKESKSSFEQNPFLKFAYTTEEKDDTIGTLASSSKKRKTMTPSYNHNPDSSFKLNKGNNDSINIDTADQMNRYKQTMQYKTKKTRGEYSKVKQNRDTNITCIINNTTTNSTNATQGKQRNLFFDLMTKEEKIKCQLKWQSFADQHAPIETRRFQVLVAARLHCRAHECTVRSAMDALKDYIVTTASSSSASFISEKEKQDLNNNSIFLDAETLAIADPNEISKVISSVLFANVKAKHIIKAAQEVKSRFRGIVPESQHGLKMITGIGPKLAQVLHHVNAKRLYTVS